VRLSICVFVAVLAASASARAADGGDEPRGERSEPNAEDTRLRLLALASARGFLATRGFLFGGGVRLERDALPAVGWSLDALYERGRVEQNSGGFDLETATLGAIVYYYRRFGLGAARIGAGVRGGVSRSSQESTLSPWGWPLLAVAVGVQPGDRITCQIGMEGSYVILPVGSGEASVKGWWLAGAVGIGVAF
jgi:hypothetical protein